MHGIRMLSSSFSELYEYLCCFFNKGRLVPSSDVCLVSEEDGLFFACFSFLFLPLAFLRPDAVAVSSRQGLIEKPVREVPTSTSEVNCTGS